MPQQPTAPQDEISAADGEPYPAKVRIGGRGVQSIEIGGRLLDALVKANHPMMLRDLASQAGLTPGQAHAYLVSFRKLELVEQDPATGRYRLGPFALHLGLVRLRTTDPYRLAAEAVVELAEALDLMVTITVWGTCGPTIVHVQESSRQIHANVKPGGVFALTGTATGKTFAAFMPRKLVEAMIETELETAARSQRIADGITREALFTEIQEIRRQGYATTVGRPVPGISALAAPVFDHTGQMQLAITLIGPSGAVDCAPGSTQAASLLRFTRKLSERLGHQPAPAPIPVADRPALTRRSHRPGDGRQ